MSISERHHHFLHLLRSASGRRYAVLFLMFLCALIIPAAAQVPTGGLIGEWIFSGNVADGTGYGNNGNVYGATLTQDRFGDSNRAYYFDGINDYIVIPDDEVFRFDSAQSFTISLWVRVCSMPNNSSTWDWMISKYPPEGGPIGGWMIAYGTPGGSPVTIGATLVGQYPTFASINDGRWHHIAVVLSDTLQVPLSETKQWIGYYVDGQLDRSRNPLPSVLNVLSHEENFGDIIIGKSPYAALYFKGSLDDIRIYTRPLSATEIGNLYSDGGWPNSAPGHTVQVSLQAVTDTVICAGDSVELRLSGNAHQYRWHTSAGLRAIDGERFKASPEMTTTYKVTGYRQANGMPCPDTVSKDVEITVVVREKPRAAAGNAQFVCKDETVVLGGITTRGTPPYRWRWSPVDGLDDPNVEHPRVTVRKTERYKVVVTDANGCMDSSEVSVTFLPSPEIDLGKDTVYFCRVGEGLRIGAEATGGNGPYVYTWRPSEGLDRTDSAFVIASPSAPTRYIVEVRDVGGCRDIDSVYVIPIDRPDAEAGPDRVICPGDAAQLGSPNVLPNLEYRWSPSDGLSDPNRAQPEATPSATTIYRLTVRDPATGCESIDEVEVAVLDVRLQIEPASLDFGSLDGCTPDSVATLRVTNSGETDATIEGTIDDSQFTLPGGSIVIPAGESVEVRVRFSPQSSGTHQGRGTLRVEPCGDELTFEVSGEKEATIVGADLGSIHFGRMLLCEIESIDTVVTITNNGTSDAELGIPLLKTPFSISAPSLPATVAAGTSLALRVRYAPTGEGIFDDELKVPFVSGDCSDTIRVSLSGEVIEPRLETTISELDFGLLDGCTGEKDSLLTVWNRTPIEIMIDDLLLPPGYAYDGPLPLQIPPSGSLQLRVRYEPGETGTHGGTMRVISSPCDDTLKLELRGEKRGVSFAVTESVDFGEIVLCADDMRSLPFEIAYDGDGTGDGTISSVTLTGPFTTTAVPGSPLNDSATTTFSITLTPTMAGAYEERMRLRLEPCGIEREVVVRALVVQAELTNTDHDFGIVGVGSVLQDEVTFVNRSNGRLPIDRIEGVVAPFRVVATVPPLPDTLEVGEALRVTIEYAALYGRSSSPVIAVVSSPCHLTFAGEVRGEGEISSWSKIGLPLLRGDAGEHVTLSLDLVESKGLDEIGATSFTAEVSFDASLLVTADGSWRKEGDRRVIAIEGVRIGEEGRLGSVELIGLLGKAESTELRLERFEWIDADGPVMIDTAHGEFVLEGLCREGGIRLYDPSGEVGIKSVSPNPGGDRVAVEYGLTEGGETGMSLVNEAGREVARLFHGAMVPGEYAITVDLRALESGAYWIVLETPSVTVTKRLFVVK